MMESGNGINNDGQPRDEAGVKPSRNRRKLIQGGLIATPVFLALKSTPVLAANCKLPSGFSTSGNLSRNGGATCTTDPAKGPAWWPNHIDGNNNFLGTGVLKNTVFNTVFAGSDAHTLMAVLRSGINFASLVVAAYLDIKALIFVSGVSDLDIKDMWNGSYKPLGSKGNWSLAESENYLRYTMGLRRSTI